MSLSPDISLMIRRRIMNADSWAPFRYSTKRQEQVRLVWIAKNMIVLLALMILPVNAFSTTPSRTMHEGCQSQRSTTVSTTTTSLTANFLPFFSRDDDDNDKMELDEALEESTTNLVAGVFETVDELRKRVNAAKYTEFLNEMLQSGTRMSPQEEERRLGELRDRLAVTRKKQERFQQALKELAKEEAMTKEKNKKEALAVAQQRLEEKITRIKEQGEVYQKQQKLVLMVAGKGSQEGNNGFPNVFQFFRRGNETTTKKDLPTKKENRTLKAIQSVPQALFSSSRSSNKNDTRTIPDDSTEKSSSPFSFGFNNPFRGAQRFMLSLVSNDWSDEKDEEWVVAFPKSRIDPGEVKPIRVAGVDLLVVATRDGKKIYCIANSCSHLGTPLETGMMERRPTKDGMSSEECIVCPLHKTAFALETGQVNGEWCPYPPVLGNMLGAIKAKSSVAVFDIRIRGKNIEIKLNSRLSDFDDDGRDTKDRSIEGKKRTEDKRE